MSFIKVVKYPNIEIESTEPYQTINYWDEDLEDLQEDQKVRKFITEQVLRNNEQAKNNDSILFFEALRLEFKDIKVKEKGGSILFEIPKKVFNSIPPAESYRRCRQKFNSEGKYLPTNPKVLERRKRKEKTMKVYFAKLKEKDNIQGIKD